MNPAQFQQFNDLVRQVSELTAWKSAREAQIIQNPLDSNSQEVVYEDVLLFKRIKAGTVIAKGVMTVEINGKDYSILYS